LTLIQGLPPLFGENRGRRGVEYSLQELFTPHRTVVRDCRSQIHPPLSDVAFWFFYLFQWVFL
jgi:hypothetical protein